MCTASVCFLSQLLPCLGSDPPLARGSHVRWRCRWTGTLPGPPPAPEHRGGRTAAHGPGASGPGHSRAASRRPRCSAGAACTSGRTWTWLNAQSRSWRSLQLRVTTGFAEQRRRESHTGSGGCWEAEPRGTSDTARCTPAAQRRPIISCCSAGSGGRSSQTQRPGSSKTRRTCWKCSEELLIQHKWQQRHKLPLVTPHLLS